ncbi:MAG: DNA primase [Verrucomicrobiales bacterium]|nr:DNA primase [Verrucomicrobiales bacterium]
MAIISQETIQRILDETDIVELIQGYFPLKRAGANYLALCPFHNEKTPSFNVSPQRQNFHCYGCGEGGDAIKFIMRYDNLPFPEAAKHLASRAGITIEEEVYDPQAQARMRARSEIKRMQKSAADWFHRLLFKSQSAQPARDYLKGRGYTMEISRNWKFGFAPEDQRSFMDWAQAEGFTVPQLVEGGLAKWRDENNPNRGAYSFFRHRLMFPVNDGMGEPIAFSGRVLSPDQKGGKYVNSPETVIFNKSKNFFGLDKTKRSILREKRAILFEGQLDLISAFEAGIENGVAGLGTALTQDHGRILKRHTDEVVLCYDSDAAGLKAASKAFRILAPSGMLIRLALLPEGEDPDSLIQSQGADALREILDSAPEFFDFQIDRRGSGLNQGPLRDRLNFAKDLAGDMALIEDKMLQDSLISRVTVRLGVGEDEIRKLVRNEVATKLRLEKTRKKREAAQWKREKQGGGNPRGNGYQQNPAGPAPEEEETFAEPGGNGDPLTIKSRAIRLLCKALLTNLPARQEICAHPVPGFFENLVETEFLIAVWNGDFNPEQPSSVNAFLGMLPPHQQKLAAAILHEDTATISPALANDCLAALRKQSIHNQMEMVKSQLGAPGLPVDRVLLLNKQLLDLRAQLHDSSQPSETEDDPF